jgi:hypothetical protein
MATYASMGCDKNEDCPRESRFYATDRPERTFESVYNTHGSPSESSLGTRGDTCPSLLALSAEHEPILTRGHERVVENGDRTISLFFRRYRVELWRYHERERVLRGVWWGRGNRDVTWTMK